MKKDYSKYKAYLESKEWKKKKEAFKASKLFKGGCFVCNTFRVDIHHKTYKRLFNERLTDLVALCRSCHNKVHDMIAFHGNREKYNLWSCVRKIKKLYKKKKRKRPYKHKPKPKRKKKSAKSYMIRRKGETKGERRILSGN